MLRNLIISVCLYLFSAHAIAQTEQSLLVSQFRQDSDHLGRYVYLVSYHFKQGLLVSSDTVMGTGSYGYFNSRDNIIYKDRYVITALDMIDLKTGQRLNKQNYDILELVGDSVLCKDNLWLDEPKGYYWFDLTTHKYKPVKNGSFYTKGGIYSPDHKHSIQYNIYKKGQLNLNSDKIVLSSQKDSKILVPYCGSTPMNDFTMGFPIIPLEWIDNENFIYANYVYRKPDYCAVITRINITTQQKDTVGMIEGIKPCRYNGRFIKKDSSLVFDCSLGYFKIDVANKHLASASKYYTGNGFTVDLKSIEEKSHICFKDEIIGDMPCRDYTCKTAENYFAMEQLVLNKELDVYFEDGVMVWNTITKQWTTLNIPWQQAVIGWRNDKN